MTSLVRLPRRPAAALLATLALLCVPAVVRAGGEEPSPAVLLHQARDLERVQGNDDAALALYEKVVADARATPEQRGEALRSMADCHSRAGRLDAAEQCWDQILADKRLAPDLRAWAQRKKDAKHRAEGATGADAAKVRERERKQWQRDQLKRYDTALADARRALAENHLAEARSQAMLAQSILPERPEAKDLLDRINAQQPGRGKVLAQFLQLLQTQDAITYDRIRREVDRLEKAARLAHDGGDWREADRLYREALHQIDDSGFLSLGTVFDPGSLDEKRRQIEFWMRDTQERGKAQGLSFEPVPPLPDLGARHGSLKARALAFLADVIRPQEAGVDPIRFYDFGVRKPAAAPKRSLAAEFVDGIRVAYTAGSLGRARWAERWIRRHIGIAWTQPHAKVGWTAKRQRLLARYGNLICAQCGEAERRRIEALLESFPDTPSALRLAVRVYAMDSAGTVRAAEALRTRAGPRDSGLAYALDGHLLTEYEQSLEGVEGVQRLGSATLTLTGASSVGLEITRLTANHPALQGLPPPQQVVVADADARYGLWLDLYAEDVDRPHSGGARSALSVVARVNQPDPEVPSHVVPKNGPGAIPWTRLPMLTERVVEADREVSHYGAFVLQGLPNPFPSSKKEHPELMILIGITRADTPIPDPPREQPAPAIVPADLVSRDYPVGALSVEVEDQAVPDGWPTLRTVAEGVPLPDRRRQRNLILADVLMRLAGVDPESPGGRDAVVVQDHKAVGLLSPEDHIHLQQGLQRLRSHENDLYQITVLSAVVGAERWQGWTEAKGATRNGAGDVLLRGQALQRIQAEMATLAARPGLFQTRRTLLARATQQVAHVALASRGITKDLAMRRLASGRVRYTPIPGTAEEGLVVEVRPMLERHLAAGSSVRSVRVRARAAKLKAIESHPYPGAQEKAEVYDVPSWYPGNEPGLSERRDAEILDDDGALLVPLAMPGSEGQRIVVYLRVRLLP
jgi:tetratricopeptide (TPR) repeat protein